MTTAEKTAYTVEELDELWTPEAGNSLVVQLLTSGQLRGAINHAGIVTSSPYSKHDRAPLCISGLVYIKDTMASGLNIVNEVTHVTTTPYTKCAEFPAEFHRPPTQISN